jgi:hypothetical protein
MFAHPRAKPRLGLGRSGVAWCYHSASTAHKLHALLANLKRLVREKLSLTLSLWILAFHLVFGGWKVEWILTLHLSRSSFSGSYLGVFENLAKKDKVPRMVPPIAQVVFVTSPKALSEPQLPTFMACMWSFGWDKYEIHLCHMILLCQRPDSRRN